jgi:hypothetical protein
MSAFASTWEPRGGRERAQKARTMGNQSLTDR